MPGILNKFFVESEFRQLPCALHGHQAPGRIRPALKNELQVIENVTGITRLEMHFGRDTKIRLQRKLPLKNLHEKPGRDSIGERVAAASGGFN